MEDQDISSTTVREEQQLGQGGSNTINQTTNQAQGSGTVETLPIQKSRLHRALKSIDSTVLLQVKRLDIRHSMSDCHLFYPIGLLN